MFSLKFAVLVGAEMVGILGLAGAQTVAPPAPVALPAWLASLRDAREEQTHTGADEIDASYRTPDAPSEVAAHYRTQMRKAEIRFNEGFDGIGVVIRCAEGKTSCVIQIRERDDGAAVKISYSPHPTPAQPAFNVTTTPTNSPATVTASAIKTEGPLESSGVRQVEYDITGTVHVVSITIRNASGGTEQRKVMVPYHNVFFARPGAFLYLSAQKTRFVKTEDGMIAARAELVDDGQAGTVQVRITCGGKVVQEAQSSAPYGIATASGKVAQ